MVLTLTFGTLTMGIIKGVSSESSLCIETLREKVSSVSVNFCRQQHVIAVAKPQVYIYLPIRFPRLHGIMVRPHPTLKTSDYISLDEQATVFILLRCFIRPWTITLNSK